MDILSFICLGLKPGCKVNITFNDNRTDTCYFDGYETLPNIIRNLDQLSPVFRKPTMNGKMGRKRIWYSIIDIRTIVPVAIFKAAFEIEKSANHSLKAIVLEMNKLFPGKKIIFDTELHGSIASTLPHKHGQGKFVDITSLYIDSKDFDRIHCDVYSEYDSFSVRLDELANTDFPALLWTTVANIKDPYLDEEYGGNFTECIGSWKEIPATIKNDTPVLHSLGIFDILRANLWFYSLPEEKRKPIEEKQSWITMNDGEKVMVWNYETNERYMSQQDTF